MQRHNTEFTQRFAQYIAPTSPAPIGIEVVKAEGCTLHLADGTRVLDALSGIGVNQLGHSHPRIVEAVVDQARRYMHVMVYGEFVQAPQVLLAERLATLLPGECSMTYFTSSGAEAIEGALKLVRKATGRKRILCFDGAYHGDTTGALALNASEAHRRPFGPLLPDIVRLPFNEPDAFDAIDENVAGVFIEPIQAEAGVRLPAPGYLAALKEACERVGALLVFDEVQVGLGRTGSWFASEQEGVHPDVVVMAKALGGGLPLGGFAASPSLMRHLAEDPPLGHLTTFGGNPVSCAAGLVMFDVMEEERLLERAVRAGGRLMEQLQALVERGLAEGVWGRGLIVALDVGEAQRARKSIARCLESGLLIGDSLHAPTVLKMLPPLIMRDDEIDRAISIVEQVLKRV